MIMRSEKRFRIIKEATLQYPICENEIQLSENQIVDLLNSQSDALISYDKLVSDLKKENERLKNKLNVTALELVDESISMGKAVEISEMNYHEFLRYRQTKGKPMELQR